MSSVSHDGGNRAVELGFLLIVTISPPLMLLQGSPTPRQLFLAGALGLLLGVIVVWYLRRLAHEFVPGRSR